MGIGRGEANGVGVKAWIASDGVGGVADGARWVATEFAEGGGESLWAVGGLAAEPELVVVVPA